MKSVLVLKDGTYFPGQGFGQSGETVGEVVFNTCMTGYQEIITNPSYRGQIVTMTYPLIGNYGFNEFDTESGEAHVKGFVVKELCDAPNNWRSTIGTDEYFKRNNIIGIKGIDTRSLTQHLRNNGSMPGIISTECGNIDVLLERLNSKIQEQGNPVMEVTVKSPVHKPGSGKKVVVMDFGVKNNIIRSLEKRKCDIYILPAVSGFDEIIGLNPDCILLSNGPGNPEALQDAVQTVKRLIGKKPILGIGLGHQIAGLALGGSTYKLKFGHHGSNYPVKDFGTGRCYITSQNHSYALNKDFGDDVEITQVNINDGTVEGIRHKKYPVLGFQYDPAAASVPTDTACFLDDFLKMM